MRCLLVGNYGVGNIGDEALKEYFLTEFSDVDWVTVSATPGKGGVPRLPLGIRSLFSPWWKTLSEIKRADAVVFGGGSLFTDVESVWACVIWASYAFAARLLGTPYLLAFQGAGPWSSVFGKHLSVMVYRGAAAVSVRDEESLKRIRDVRPDTVLAFDPAFALFARRKSANSSGDLRTLTLIPRMNSGAPFLDQAKELVDSGDYDRIQTLLFEPEAEERISRAISERFPASTCMKIVSVSQMLDLVKASSFVLTQRFHGGLAALACGVPCELIKLKDGDKLDTLQRSHADPGRTDAWIELTEKGALQLRNWFQSGK